jgi:hypothetical protein
VGEGFGWEIGVGKVKRGEKITIGYTKNARTSNGTKLYSETI